MVAVEARVAEAAGHRTVGVRARGVARHGALRTRAGTHAAARAAFLNALDVGGDDLAGLRIDVGAHVRFVFLHHVHVPDEAVLAAVAQVGAVGLGLVFLFGDGDGVGHAYHRGGLLGGRFGGGGGSGSRLGRLGFNGPGGAGDGNRGSGKESGKRGLLHDLFLMACVVGGGRRAALCCAARRPLSVYCQCIP